MISLTNIQIIESRNESFIFSVDQDITQKRTENCINAWRIVANVFRSFFVWYLDQPKIYEIFFLSFNFHCISTKKTIVLTLSNAGFLGTFYFFINYIGHAIKIILTTVQCYWRGDNRLSFLIEWRRCVPNSPRIKVPLDAQRCSFFCLLLERIPNFNSFFSIIFDIVGIHMTSQERFSVDAKILIF